MSVRKQLQNCRVCTRILLFETAFKNVASIAKGATTPNISDPVIDNKKRKSLLGFFAGHAKAAFEAPFNTVSILGIAFLVHRIVVKVVIHKTERRNLQYKPVPELKLPILVLRTRLEDPKEGPVDIAIALQLSTR